ncbi:MAG: signal peptidase II [Alphaproteobacteria bacterium]|nr:signal peptidase II [Alphaproteobacteria bacterium]
MFIGLNVALLVVFFDQISKYVMLNKVLGEHIMIYVAPFFNLVRAWNTGVSFSMFNNYGNLGAWVLSGLAIIIVGFLIYWLKSEENREAQIALGMIIGGAIGNVIDRVRLGAVFDFLDFHIGENHWPAFNVADSFICIGAAVLIAQNLIVYFKQKKGK